MWFILTILAVVSRAIYGVLTKVLSNNTGVSAITQTTLLMIAATLWGAVLSPFVGGFHIAAALDAWPVLLIAIVTSGAGNLLYFKGIAMLESSTTQIAFSSILIWSAIMSWVFLGTRLHLLQSLGVLVLLFAILLAQYQKKSVTLGRGIWLIIASAACFAGFQVSSAILAKTVTPGTYLIATYLGDALLIGLPYLGQVRADLARAHHHLSRLTTVAVVTGAASILYNVFAYLAYKVAPSAGIVVLLLTSQVVLAILLSIVFLKERTRLGTKLSAGVLAVVAAMMIKS